MKNKLKSALRRRKSKQHASPEEYGSSGVPRITNETVAVHREEVLGKARKYIYPLQHSKHRIVIISITLFITMIVAFFTYCVLALYRFQANSIFLYRVTQVIPFPIARTGSRFVAYENYLFELRRYTHYYNSKQELDFNSDAGQKQLSEFRKRALDKVINDAYVKELAKDNNITVSNKELDDQVEIVRRQNRLGNSEKVFEDVLKEFWGWTVDDFKRSLRQQLLAQKVVAALDGDTKARADSVLVQLKAGAPFEDLAKKHSDDTTTKEQGGDLGILIDQANRDLTAKTTETLFTLQKGEYSGIINIGYALEIVKVLDIRDDKVRGAHILFNFKDISTFINDLKEKNPTRAYISFPSNGINDTPTPAQTPEP